MNNDHSPAQTASLLDKVGAYLTPKVMAMLFLGFSAGLPFFLIFSTLSLWLREAGVDRAEVTYFSWAALGYSFKFVWAPLVGSMPLPFVTRWLGQRRSWLLLSQLMIIGSIIFMASVDPAVATNGIVIMAFCAVALGFSSATQDIVIDAYRIESAGPELQAMMSAMYVAGYRIGLLVSGAGALFLADYFGSSSEAYVFGAWQTTYFVMAGVMLVGVVTTLIISEPLKTEAKDLVRFTSMDHGRLFSTFLLAVGGFVACYFFSSGLAESIKGELKVLFANAVLASVVTECVRLVVAVSIAVGIARLAIAAGAVNRDLLSHAYVQPITDFFLRYSGYQILLLFLLIALYRVSDIVLGVSANIFYQDMGFTKSEIAAVAKVFGFAMSLAGGFIGGVISVRFGVVRTLFIGGVLSALTNLMFVWMAKTGHSLPMLYWVISADNLAAGLAVAAFVAFLSSLVNIEFTAMQYAIFSSLMTLFPKILGGYSGSLVDTLGYENFFMLTALMGVPVLLVIVLLSRQVEISHPGSQSH